MTTWGAQLRELNEIAQQILPPDGVQKLGEQSPHDVLRRRYLKRLNERTGRAVIVYATAFLDNKGAPPESLTIGLGDKQGFMEAVSNVEEKQLDLILHSPGGSAEAAEAILDYLRTRFDHIRVIVPVAAMSAATMMALASDEIVMGDHSQLGPIDPQFTIMTPEGPRSAPGQAILDQFELAKQEIAVNPNSVGAWLPILRSYAPGLISMCTHAREAAKDFATRSLQEHMFAGDANSAAKAAAAADWFSNFSFFRSHGRRVTADEARAQGLKVTRLEADDDLQDAFLSVHHAVMHTLSGTPCFKLIENHHGRAFVQVAQQQVIQGPMLQIAPPDPPGGVAGRKPPPPPPRKKNRR